MGILPHERGSTQFVMVDCAVIVDAQKIAETDQIEDAIDYVGLRQSIITYLSEHRFQLLETLADRLASFLMKKYTLSWLQLSVTKPTIFSDAKGVGVVVERS